MDKEEFVKSHGFSTYYNENYWVHMNSVEDPQKQDFTNYGFCLEDAIKWIQLGKPKFKYMGLPGLSKLEMAHRTKGLMENEQ